MEVPYPVAPNNAHAMARLTGHSGLMAWRDRIEDAGLDLRSRIRNRLTVSRRLSVVEFDNRRLIDRMADLEVEVTRLGHELEGLRAEGAEVPF